MKFYDIDNDPNGNFLYQKLGYSIDISIKEASAEEVDYLPKEAFAWPEKRLYRIDNEKVAAINSVYVKSQEEVLPTHVVSNMSSALTIYKLGWPEVEKVAEAEDPDDYIFPDHKRLLVKTAEDVKEVEEILLKQADSMNVPSRTFAFNRLLKKASHFNVELTNSIYKYCGLSRTNVRGLREQIYKRAKYIKPSQTKKAYLFLADKLEKSGSILEDYVDQQELATTLYDLDKEAGLTHKYNKKSGFLDPILSVYNLEKRAEDFMDLAGKEIPINQIMRLDPSLVADVIGDDFLEDVMIDGQVNPEEMRDVIETLPNDLKGRLVSYLGL